MQIYTQAINKYFSQTQELKSHKLFLPILHSGKCQIRPQVLWPLFKQGYNEELAQDKLTVSAAQTIQVQSASISREMQV